MAERKMQHRPWSNDGRRDVFELDGGIGRRHENWNHSIIRESEQKNFI